MAENNFVRISATSAFCHDELVAAAAGEERESRK
jgi:hypothetical protein